MSILVSTAIISEPAQILCGLVIFTITLFAIPVFFSKVPSIVTQLITFTLYMVREFKGYLFPSPRSLENVEEKIQEHDSSLTISPNTDTHDTVAEEVANETTLDKMLNIIWTVISNPRLLIKLLREDWNISKSHVDPGYVIKFKLKSLFIIFAVIGASVVLFSPVVAAFGPGAIAGTLIKWGLSVPIAKYAVVVITGGTIYSSRTLFVAIAVLGKKMFGNDKYTALRSNSDDPQKAEQKDVDSMKTQESNLQKDFHGSTEVVFTLTSVAQNEPRIQTSAPSPSQQGNEETFVLPCGECNAANSYIFSLKHKKNENAPLNQSQLLSSNLDMPLGDGRKKQTSAKKCT